MERAVIMILSVMAACIFLTILYVALLKVNDEQQDFCDDMADRLKVGDVIKCMDIPEMIDLCADLGREGISTEWNCEEYGRGEFILHVTDVNSGRNRGCSTQRECSGRH